MFAAKSTGGFYDPEKNGKNIPEDAVKITAMEYAKLLEGESQGMVISWDDEGKPFLTERVISEAELQWQTNVISRGYLASTDWYVTRQQETGVLIPEEVVSKRKEARESVK